MRYQVSDSLEYMDDGPFYDADSARDAALEDADGMDGMSDGFTSYVRDENGRVTQVEITWVPGHWEAS